MLLVYSPSLSETTPLLVRGGKGDDRDRCCGVNSEACTKRICQVFFFGFFYLLNCLTSGIIYS